jgi:hypothetical protein
MRLEPIGKFQNSWYVISALLSVLKQKDTPPYVDNNTVIDCLRAVFFNHPIRRELTVDMQFTVNTTSSSATPENSSTAIDAKSTVEAPHIEYMKLPYPVDLKAHRNAVGVLSFDFRIRGNEEWHYLGYTKLMAFDKAGIKSKERCNTALLKHYIKCHNEATEPRRFTHWVVKSFNIQGLSTKGSSTTAHDSESLPLLETLLGIEVDESITSDTLSTDFISAWKEEWSSTGVLNLAIVDKNGNEHPLPQSVWIAKSDSANRIGLIAKKILNMIHKGELTGEDAANKVNALKEAFEFRTSTFKFFDDGEIDVEDLFSEEPSS